MKETTNNPFAIFERFFVLEWLLAFVLVLIARLPYLLSDHVFFDGDEAMIGIMGRDLITGKNLPLYFYGQRYGFSFFEAIAAGIFIPFLGSSVWSLKFGGMLLFSLGIQRFLQAFRTNQSSTINYLLLAIVLVIFPSWVVWGTKLRGGYLTAFVCIAFVTELFLAKSVWNRSTWIKVGALSALTIVAQPLFILPVSFLSIARFGNSKRLDILAGITVGGLLLIVLRALAFLNPNYWNHPMQFTFNVESLKVHLIENLIPNFTGFFAFTDHYEVPSQVFNGAVVFLVILGIWTIYSLFKSNTRLPTLLMILGTIAATLVLPFFALSGGRYLLPFFTGLLILIVFLSSIDKQKTGTIFLTLLLTAAAPTLTGFDKYVSYWLVKEEPDLKRLNELVETLKSQRLTYGFASEWQVLWQLNYLGNEEMAFRYLDLEERVPRFVTRANACFVDTNCTTVLTGGLWPLQGMEKVEGWEDRIEVINARYYIMVNPDTTFLNKGKYELP